MGSLANSFLQNYITKHQQQQQQFNLLGSGPMNWLTNAAIFAGSDALLNKVDNENHEKHNHFWRNAGLAGALALGYQYYKNHFGNNYQAIQLDPEQQLQVIQQPQMVAPQQAPLQEYVFPFQLDHISQELLPLPQLPYYSNMMMMQQQQPQQNPYLMMVSLQQQQQQQNYYRLMTMMGNSGAMRPSPYFIPPMIGGANNSTFLLPQQQQFLQQNPYYLFQQQQDLISQNGAANLYHNPYNMF